MFANKQNFTAPKLFTSFKEQAKKILGTRDKGSDKSKTILNRRKKVNLPDNNNFILTDAEMFSDDHWVLSPERFGGDNFVGTIKLADANKATHCYDVNCKKKFSIVVRKHHCFLCGQVFCGRCSGMKVVLKTNEKIRRRSCIECTRFFGVYTLTDDEKESMDHDYEFSKDDSSIQADADQSVGVVEFNPINISIDDLKENIPKTKDNEIALLRKQRKSLKCGSDENFTPKKGNPSF
jgi:hypothetical protein